MSEIAEPVKKKKNLYISYIKGVAIIGIILIHLFDWSNMVLPFGWRVVQDILKLSVFFFVLAAGSVLFIAYEKRSMEESLKKLIYRGGQILFFYYLYSIIKLLVFDFSTEPLYYQFINNGTFTIKDILLFRSSSVPITILITFAFLTALSPLVLLAQKKTRRPEHAILLLTIGVFIINYFTPISSLDAPVLNFLYARGNVTFAIMLWFVPFLIGFYLAQSGFEKQRRKILLVGSALTFVSVALLFAGDKSLWLSDNEVPLAPYFIFAGLLVLALLLYLFPFLENLHYKFVNGLLAGLRLLGDNTLYVYLFQWITIDLTRWAFGARVMHIWWTVSLYLIFYLIYKRRELLEYYKYQKEST